MKIAERRARATEKGALKLLEGSLGHIMDALLMLVLTRAAPLNDGTPFAFGCLSAGLTQGRSPVAMLIGLFLGCPWELNGVQAFAPALGALALVGAHLLIGRLPFLKDKHGELRQRDLCSAALAGGAMLCASLPFVRELPYDLIMAPVNAMLAMVTAPTLISLFHLDFRRSKLLAEEQLALVLTMLAALVGLRMMPGVGLGLSHLLASLITLAAALCSIGTGTTAGVLCGSALALMGDNPYVGVALALCGLLAGAVRPLGRPAMALSFMLGNAISLIYTAGEQIGVINPYVALLAGVAICFLPPVLEQKLTNWFVPTPLNQNADRVIGHLRADAERKVRALGLLFEEMSQGYDTPSPLPDEQALVGRMRERLCHSCPNYERCWGGNSVKASRLLVELLSDAMCGRLVEGEVSELPPDLFRRCRRAGQIPKKLGPMLSEFDTQRRAAKERGECKALLSSQFHQAADMLLSEGDRLARPLRLDKGMAERAFAALDQEGLEAEGVWAVEDDLPQLFVGLKGKYWSRSAANRAARGLSSALGVEMRATAVGEQVHDDELCFVPAPRLSVDIGFAGRAGQNGTQSGDSHLTGSLSDGRVLLALSDGMGSGARAQQESASALRLLKRFLGAGVPCAMALDAINELLLLRNGDEMFATADLCLLDLNACRAEFSKLGGCASLILRGDRILRVEGGMLPMGVFNKVTPLAQAMRLQSGDLIVMVTDGLMDCTREGQDEWLEAMLRRYKAEPPQKLCERLVSLAAQRGASRDDMTALVAKIGVA